MKLATVDNLLTWVSSMFLMLYSPDSPNWVLISSVHARQSAKLYSTLLPLELMLERVSNRSDLLLNTMPEGFMPILYSGVASSSYFCAGAGRDEITHDYLLVVYLAYLIF